MHRTSYCHTLMKTRHFCITTILLFVAISIGADNLSFNPTTKFRIESQVLSGSAIALGSNHGVNSPVCITGTSTTDADCYWYILEYKTGKYAIRNAKTGQYLAFDEVRSDNPVRRYMHLENSVRNDSALWTIGEHSDGVYYFQSAVAETYCFNVRTNNYVLGTYNQGGTPTAYNELFYIFKEDGTAYDATEDKNTICGIDDNGYYWTSSNIEHPVVYTTDDSNPIYYTITNVRTGLYINPANTLMQSTTLPEKRFYFKEMQDGVQIMVEGGDQYVSGELTTTTATTAYDVKIEKGTPSKDDHTWTIGYSEQYDYPGYAIGVSKCSANSSTNPHFYGSSYYWNAFKTEGVCYYKVDGGSTFLFQSKDIRHRNYLAGLGLVIPNDSDTPIEPVDPTPPADTVTTLEPITGTITHVYRADGKVDAIPTVYIETLDTEEDSIHISIKDNGPAFNYASYEVDSISTVVPQQMPVFNSFKFNNKYNPHLIGDAIGVFYGDSLITLNPLCIGKRLRPSFKLDDDAEAYIGNVLQHSKVSRTRYDHDVTYTIARRGYTILRRYANKTYELYPYGHETKVRVTYATDQATSQYKVPTIYITTDDGTMISSKTTYWDAKISIDGAGVFPDMAETAMQIKGRGNSSWAGTWGKSPYHMKFATAVKPLGLTKGKHWNLIANAQTNSMTTNAIAMKMAQLVETAGYNHEIPVELYINGNYRGSYNLTEKVGFSNNSIDLLDETYAVMLELDSYYDEPYKFRTTRYSLPVNIKEPDLSEGTSPLTSVRINQHFNKVITALYNKEDMSQYLDLDYLARFLFVDELSLNTEFMHPKSTFCYNEDITNENSKYIFGPVWDFDWGYGYQFRGNYFTYPANTDFWNCTSMEATTWTRDLRYCGDNFDKIYYNLWHNFVNDGRLDELVEFCQDYYDYAAESFTHDNTVWSSGDATSYATVTDRAKTWLKQRAEYILNYMSNTLGYADNNYLEQPQGDVVGDVNGDGVVSTADLVCVLNYMLSLPNEDFNYTQADQDANNMITINDALAIRDLIPQSASSRRFYSMPEAEAALSLGMAEQSASSIDIPLGINIDGGTYCGVQFDLSVPSGTTIEDLDLSNSIPNFEVYMAELKNPSTDADHYRVSIYSSAKNTLPQGHSTIGLHLNQTYSTETSELQTVSLSNAMFVSTTGEDNRTASCSTQFCNSDLTGINTNAWIMSQDGNKLTINSTADTVMGVYGIDGRLYRVYKLNMGHNAITLPQGVYVINKKKIIIR